MYLFNIRSWNGHLKHFLSDMIYSSYYSLICFTETNLNNSTESHEILDELKDTHKNIRHGLVLCYNTRTLYIMEVIDFPSVLKVLPIVLEIEKETFIDYMLGPLGSIIDDFILLINELPRQHRVLVVSDFNLDQMLPEHLILWIPKLFLLCRYSTVITLFFFSKSDALYLCRLLLSTIQLSILDT